MKNCWDISADALAVVSSDKMLMSIFDSIDASYNTFLTQDELAKVLGIRDASQAQHLKCINLTYTCITDRFVLRIARYAPNLRSIILDGCSSITDLALFALAEYCPSLTKVSLAMCEQISDNGIVALSRGLPQLQALNLSGCRHVTGKSLKHIVARCPLIQSLHIGRTGIDAETLQWLLSFFLLVEVDLTELPLADSHLKLLLQNQPLLKKLNISFCHELTRAGIEAYLAAANVEEVIAFGLSAQLGEFEDARLIY